MRPLKFFSMLALAMFVGALTHASDPGVGSYKRSTEGSIQGYIVDAVTHKPITGVSVLLQGKLLTNDLTLLSDNSGFFKFAKLPQGEVTLVFEKKGYKVFKSESQPIREGLTKISVEVQPVDDDYDSWHPIKKFMDLD